MVEQRANLDYGLDDRPLDEVAEMPNDDYLTMERVEEAGHPLAADEDEPEETDAPSTYGAP